jgi:hypothetical protein
MSIQSPTVDFVGKIGSFVAIAICPKQRLHYNDWCIHFVTDIVFPLIFVTLLLQFLSTFIY